MAIDPKTGHPIDNATLPVADVKLTRDVKGAIESSLTAQDIHKAIQKLKDAHLPINLNVEALANKLAHEAAYHLDQEVAKSMKPAMKFYSNVLGTGSYGVMPNAREVGSRTDKTKLIIIAGTMHELSSFIDSKRFAYEQMIKVGKKEYKPEEVWGITTNNGIQCIQGLEFKDMEFAWIGSFEKGASFSEMVDYIVSHYR
jgi:hypothetical protein